MGTLCGSVGLRGSVAELLMELPMDLFVKAQAGGEKIKSLLTDDRRRSDSDSDSVGRRSAYKEYLASRAMPAGAATWEPSRGLGWLACRESPHCCSPSSPSTSSTGGRQQPAARSSTHSLQRVMAGG
jgi:hypothetical protein